MKRFIRGGLATFAILIGTSAFAGDVFVNGYYRGDGTYVQPHYRSAADSSYNNNWGVSPNVNPYTGRVGTLTPTYNDRTPTSGYGLSGGYRGFRDSGSNCGLFGSNC